MTPFSAFITLGISSAGASLLLWNSLSLRLNTTSWARVKTAIPTFLSQHWHYAKWVLGSAFVSWLDAIAYLPLVGSIAGFEDAGILQAMQNLVKPLQNIITGCGLLFLPWISRQRAAKGEGYAIRMTLRLQLAILAAGCVYLVPLGVGRRWIVSSLYGQEYYRGFVWLLPYLCSASLISSLLQGLSIWLKAFEHPGALFWSQTAGAVLTLSVGLGLVWAFHLSGAAVALNLVNVVMAMVLIYFLRRDRKLRT